MRLSSAAFGLLTLLLSTPQSALAAPYEAGTVLLRVRSVVVAPDVSSSVNIGGKISLTRSYIPEVDLSYFFSPHWAVEVIAGTTKHSIYYEKNTKLGTVFLLPPTVTLQYHFDPINRFQFYVGAGPNWTLFYNKSVGPLGKLRTTDNWGIALQAGTDIALTEDGRYFLNIDAKKIWLSTHASFSGSPATAAIDIDPWLIGAGIGIRF